MVNGVYIFDDDDLTVASFAALKIQMCMYTLKHLFYNERLLGGGTINKLLYILVTYAFIHRDRYFYSFIIEWSSKSEREKRKEKGETLGYTHIRETEVCSIIIIIK